jgi:N-acetylglucosamine kinase-like BadF-type ATPase
MSPYYLGGDLGGSKTHVVIADGDGKVWGFGEAGPGNHEGIGFSGVKANLGRAINHALESADLTIDQIDGAGFGIGGFDWAIEYEPHIEMLRSLGLRKALEIVNDAELGLLAGSPQRWGVAVVSGTGCNCRGWDVTRTRRGRVTGGGLDHGEFAGASELIFMTTRALAYEWTGRGPKTQLSQAFIEKHGVKDLEQLLQDNICHLIDIDAEDAPLVFKVAEQGDPVELELVRWAGRELGELAVTVIRQLDFQEIEFDLVQIGSMFDGSPLLTEEMKKRVHAFAPGANFIRLREPPVLGAVILGMEKAGYHLEPDVRLNLMQSISRVQRKGHRAQ